MKLFATALAGALLIASPAAAAAATVTDAPSQDRASATGIERPYNIAWGKFRPLEAKKFDGGSCPSGTPYLSNKVYHPRWNETLTSVPPGVEIQSDIPVKATFKTTDKKGVSGGGTVYNGNLSEATVYITLHCTDVKPA